MACKRDQALIELAGKQHDVVARRQLFALGFTRSAVQHALRDRRLFPTEWRGVYATRPRLGRYGRLMAAVLWAGPDAVISHQTAGELWQITSRRAREIHLSVPAARKPRSRPGTTVHRRALARRDMTRQRGIPVTTPLRTLIDLAARAKARREAERLIDEADARNVLRADTLRGRLEHERGPGVPLLREIFDRDAFVLTDSHLERLFPPLARLAGMPKPESQAYVNGHRVDFYFRELDLVVECVSLRYHRTAAQQRRDHLRSQAHAAAGTAAVPFTHDQIAHEPDYVIGVLRRLEERLRPLARTPGRPRAA